MTRFAVLLVAMAACRPSSNDAPPPTAPMLAATPAAAPAPAPAPAPVPSSSASATTPTPAPSDEPAATTATDDDDDVREAVFRHIMKKNASGQQQAAQVFCLAVGGGKDPSAALMARFRTSKVPVVPTSECSASPDKGVVHKKTGRHGLVFRIDTMKRLGPDKVEANGGYYEAGLSASGNVYTVEKKSGAWTVTNDVMQWIS